MVFDDMAAALDGHQITDDNGQVSEQDEQSLEQEPAVPEEAESATSEKTTEPEEAQAKEAESEEDPNIAEDERGRKYIPEKRFKEIYAKSKRLERELEEAKKFKVEIPDTSKPVQPIDRQAQIENELLFTKMPEFDPASDNYNKELDQVAANIYLAKNGTITKLEAARQARSLASKITEKVAGIRSDANSVKREQADSGITQRVTSRASTQPDTDNMNDLELEAYLKSIGQW